MPEVERVVVKRKGNGRVGDRAGDSPTVITSLAARTDTNISNTRGADQGEADR